MATLFDRRRRNVRTGVFDTVVRSLFVGLPMAVLVNDVSLTIAEKRTSIEKTWTTVSRKKAFVARSLGLP
jgi:hypothetical protein